jgi:hypothetical protein
VGEEEGRGLVWSESVGMSGGLIGVWTLWSGSGVYKNILEKCKDLC